MALASTSSGPTSPGEDLGWGAVLAPPQGPGEIGRLGHYAVRRVLGRGGFGIVFLAEDLTLHRPVALKVLAWDKAIDPSERERFLQEARAAAAIQHDHVVTIFHVGEEGTTSYIAMEYLRGISLEKWLASGKRATVPQILRIARETAQGLAAAHDRGLIHRDLKPGNLWLEAPKGRVKLLDFGLAKRQEREREKQSSVLGTPAYMSPEQARGLPLDGRSDLFNLGILMYEMAAGCHPFSGATPYAKMSAIATETETPLSQHRDDLPTELVELIHQLLRKRPDQRPPSANAVVAKVMEMETARWAERFRQTVPEQSASSSVNINAPTDLWQEMTADVSSPKLAQLDVSLPPLAARRAPMPRPSRAALPLFLGGLIALAMVLWANMRGGSSRGGETVSVAWPTAVLPPATRPAPTPEPPLVLGPIPLENWSIIGPFPLVADVNLQSRYPPDLETDLTKSYPGKGKLVAWFPVRAVEYLVNLKIHLDDGECLIGYAVTFITVPQPTAARLLFSTDDGCMIWLNGQQLYANEVVQMARPPKYAQSLPLQLQAGTNELKFKVSQLGGEWEFLAAIESQDGKGLRGVTHSAVPPRVPARAGVAPGPGVPTTPGP